MKKLNLEKKIDQFREREALEIKNLEKFVLKQEEKIMRRFKKELRKLN